MISSPQPAPGLTKSGRLMVQTSTPTPGDSLLDLVIETSSSQGSIALGNENVIVQRIDFETTQRASQALFPALMRLGLPRLKLRQVIVGIGPGSFSGIRVGLAAAQAIGLAQHCPVVGICSAFSVARQFSQVTRLGVYADAKRGEIFCTEFTHGELLQSTYLIRAEDLEESVSRFTQVVSAEPLPVIQDRARPRAEDLLLTPRTGPGWTTEGPLEPIYLRSAEPVLKPKKTLSGPTHE